MSRSSEASVASVFATTMRNSALLRLEMAWAAYNGAEWAVYVALLVYAYGIGGATASGLMALVQLVPCIFLAPYLGALTDRRRPGRVLLAAYLLQGVAMACAAAAMALGAPAPVVFGLAVLINIGITIPRPAQSALLPSVVRAPVELTAANVVSSWMDNGSALVAPAVGGLLIALGGPQLSIAVLAVLAFGAAALVWPVPGPPPIAESGGGSLTGQVLHGIKVVWGQKDIRVLVSVLGAQYIVVGALDVLYVVLAISVLGMGEQGAGYLNSAFGAGALVGSMLAALLVARRRLTPALVAGMVTAALALGALGAYPTVASAFLLLAMAGVGRAVIDVTGRILLQRAASPEVLANVFAVLEALMNVGLAIGAVLVPLLVGLSGAPAALIGTGVVFLLVLLLALRGLRSVDSDADVPHVEIRLLQSIPLFSRLPAPKLEALARALQPTEYAAGQTMMCEGEPGDFYCAVARGEVEVAHAGQVVAHLMRGEGFGEIALLEDVPRTATVTATEPTTAYCLEKDQFILALTGHPAARTMADGVVAQRRDELRLVESGRRVEGGRPGTT